MVPIQRNHKKLTFYVFLTLNDFSHLMMTWKMYQHDVSPLSHAWFVRLHKLTLAMTKNSYKFLTEIDLVGVLWIVTKISIAYGAFWLEKCFYALNNKKKMVWKVMCKLYWQKIDKNITTCNS